MADYKSLSTVLSTIQDIEDGASLSLTQYVKRSIISSRVFIDNALATEDSLKNLMSTVMNLYVGLIMTAFSMNQFCTGTKKIRDVMSVVATEGFDLKAQFTSDALKKFFPGMEDLDDDIVDAAKDTSEWLHDKNPLMGSTNVKEAKESELPSGRVIKIDMNIQGNKFSFDMFLQLAQQFIPSDVARQFIKLNFTPTFKQRYLQAKAGEISFFGDLLMCQDIRKQRLNALKHDKNGVLTDMLERQQNALENAWLKYAQVTPQRQNIANTILVFEKTNFDKACSDAGLRFSDYNSRQQFFTKTFSMMICVVDPMYNQVNIYYNGLNAASTFTFDQLKKKSGSNASDVLDMMKAYAANAAPKF